MLEHLCKINWPWWGRGERTQVSWEGKESGLGRGGEEVEYDHSTPYEILKELIKFLKWPLYVFLRLKMLWVLYKIYMWISFDFLIMLFTVSFSSSLSPSAAKLFVFCCYCFWIELVIVGFIQIPLQVHLPGSSLKGWDMQPPCGNAPCHEFFSVLG